MAIPDLLLTSAHRLSIEMHAELEMENVSSMALLAMRLLARSRHPRRPRTLAAALGCSRSSTTELIARLVRDELVERNVDPHDGRARLLVLTEHGVATANAASAALDRCMGSFTESFEDEEREQLGVLLEKLERGADCHRAMRLWRTHQSSPRRDRRPLAIHIR